MGVAKRVMWSFLGPGPEAGRKLVVTLLNARMMCSGSASTVAQLCFSAMWRARAFSREAMLISAGARALEGSYNNCSKALQAVRSVVPSARLAGRRLLLGLQIKNSRGPIKG